MRNRRKLPSEPATHDVAAALAALGADELRELLRNVLLELDERSRGRVVNALINRAARSGSSWTPAAVSDTAASEALAFAGAAQRAGHANPEDVDERLRRGSAAFLRKDYAAAHRILGALLPPIGDGEIDLGQDEMMDEVLAADPGECAAQYVVSAYMLAAPGRRAEAVSAAIDEVRGVGDFSEPLREMERVAVEPLPRLDDFLRDWRAVVAKQAGRARRSDWDTEADRWQREVVRRLDGAAGLAEIARSTKRADDLRAWCESLVETRDWQAALSAFEEAAAIVADKDHARGELLDGAALAAQELGHQDLSPWLERAWRAAPSMLRLRRWLGSSRTRTEIKERAAEALAECPKRADRQHAFLHVLRADFASAAKLLSAAPGLGWSESEHPGRLLFCALQALLTGESAMLSAGGGSSLSERGLDGEELMFLAATPDEPRIATPEVGEILRQAGVDGVPGPGARSAVLAAMRKAAERRVAGVTEQKRRSRYGHAAELVAGCLACDRTPDTLRWAAAVRAEHRRFPAFVAELDRRVKAR